MITSLSKKELEELNRLFEKVVFKADKLTKITEQAQANKLQVGDCVRIHVVANADGELGLVFVPISCS